MPSPQEPVAGLPDLTPPSRKWARFAAWLVGVALLAGAIAVVAGNRGAIAEAWSALRCAPMWLIVALALSPILNLAVVARSFSVMLRPYGRVGGMEMFAVISSAWLLNQLPLRPGLFGRFAYHRVVNGIRIRDAVRATIEVLACAAGALVVLIGFALLAAQASLTMAASVTFILAPVPVLAGATWLVKRSTFDAMLGRFTACIGWRYLDLLIWIGRYYLLFTVMGRSVTWMQATVIAASSQAAMLLPVQFGVREWVVGFISARLLSSPGTALEAMTPGLLADMTIRAVEIAVGVPIGLAAFAWLHRRLAAAGGPKPAVPSNV